MASNQDSSLFVLYCYSAYVCDCYFSEIVELSCHSKKAKIRKKKEEKKEEKKNILKRPKLELVTNNYAIFTIMNHFLSSYLIHSFPHIADQTTHALGY